MENARVMGVVKETCVVAKEEVLIGGMGDEGCLVVALALDVAHSTSGGYYGDLRCRKIFV